MGFILHVLHTQVAPSLAISYIGTAGLFACTEPVNIEPSVAEQELCSQG